MLAIHPDARTTPAVRAEIARSGEPAGELARRFGVSTETVREWRERGPDDCLDRSARPHKLPWKASEEERAVVCALRRATGFPLDDLTFVVRHFLPHLGRDAVSPIRQLVPICLAAERYWDQARWAIGAYAWRFDGLERVPRTGGTA